MKIKGEVGREISEKVLRRHISGKFRKRLETSWSLHGNPMVRAHHAWTIVSGQLNDIMGTAIFNNWFKDIRPIVIADNILILQTKKDFDIRWLNCHYIKLINTLLGFQDERLTCSFVTSKESTAIVK